jgi:MFS-type transporter involved in bile tolerance (Atg22 family)
VRAIAGFLIRLVGYALVLGVTARIAQSLWIGHDLDASIDLQTFHDTGISVLVIAPLVLALIGFGVLRRVAIFVAAFLVGVAITAPFALARFAGG